MKAARYICVLFSSASILACTSDRSADQVKKVLGGTITISAAADADNLFPPMILTLQGKQISDQIFDNLADIGPGLNTVGDAGFQPHLAKSWRWAPDSTWIEFSINPAARWHDGRPVTSRDIQYTFNLIADTTLGSPLSSNVENVDSVTTSDSLAAKIWIHEKLPSAFFKVASPIPILPEHLLASIKNSELASAPFGRHPIGSGRFRFGEWKEASSITVIADSTNYRGRPNADRVTWLVASDYTAAVLRFLSGQADFIDVVKSEYVGKLVAGGKLLKTTASLDYGYLAFNLRTSDGKRLHPLFSDRSLRRALVMGVDRNALARNVFDTLGRVAHGPFTTALATADTTIGLPFDTVAAGKTLDSLGWRKATDGFRHKGKAKLQFSVSTPSSSTIRNQYAVLLQEQWKKLGADVRIETMELSTFGARLERRQFETILNGWHIEPDPSSIREEWTTSAIRSGGYNIASYSNPAVDVLLDSAQKEFDAARGVSMYRRAYRIITDDAPAMWLYELRGALGVSPRINVGQLRPDAWWANIADWTISAKK